MRCCHATGAGDAKSRIICEKMDRNVNATYKDTYMDTYKLPFGRFRCLEQPPAATCRFQDPKPIFVTPWHNRRPEIIPFQYAAALGGKGILRVGVGEDVADRRCEKTDRQNEDLFLPPLRVAASVHT